MIYLDTNIFMYAVDEGSQYYAICDKLTGAAAHNKIKTSTSAETIQEIIHLLRNRVSIKRGVEVASFTMTIVHDILPIDEEVLQQYLLLVKKYGQHKKVASRDFLHLATCVVNKIDTIITYDADFRKFKEVKAMTPEEYLEKFVN